jgi:RHS repeat-associated protein
MYQGQYEDAETGLYYNWFRYYDPESGNYISQDPIGLAGNNPTLYAYVKDVNKQVDIWGLDPTITVLGHYPEYIELAKKTDARVFSLPDKVWKNMSDAEIWEANKKFLDRTYKKGHDVLLATPFDKARTGSYFEKELDYMTKNKGYTLSEDGKKLIHPKNKCH